MFQGHSPQSYLIDHSFRRSRKSKSKPGSISTHLLPSPHDQLNSSQPENLPKIETPSTRKRHKTPSIQNVKPFISPNRSKKELSLIPVPTNSRPSVLQKGQSTNKSPTELGNPTGYTNQNKRLSGKMFLNDLWSKRYSRFVTQTSLLAEQPEELEYSRIQTNDERLREADGLYYMKHRSRENKSIELINKYRNDVVLTRDDISFPVNVKNRSRSPPSPYNNSILQKSPLLGSAKERSSLDQVISEIADEEKLHRPSYISPFEMDPPTLGDRYRKASNLGLTRLSTDESINSKSRSPPKCFTEMTSPANASRHSNKIRFRRQNKDETESEIKNGNSHSISHGKISILKGKDTDLAKHLESMDISSIQDSLGRGSQRKKPENLALGAKIVLRNLVQNCEVISKDQVLYRLVNRASQEYGGTQQEAEKRERKLKLINLRKQNLANELAYLNQERKKREKERELHANV